MRWQVPHLFALVVLFSAIAPELAAQRFAERQTLSQRRRAGVAYDQARSRMVMFGGAQNRGTTFVAGLRETWEWDAVSWTRRSGLAGEPNASDSTRGMVYDPVLGRVVLANFNGQLFEMLRWEGLRWQPINTASRPSFRQHYSVAYDELRRRIVLWGGSDPTGAQLDVWEYDGTNWNPVSAPGPTGRNDPTLAWDGVRGKIILFGGRTIGATPTPIAEMFDWDGSAWTRLTPATVPAARSQHSMTWDPLRRRVVMFGGGVGVPGTVLDDTWEWDGTNWVRVAPTTTPPGRCGHGATFHAGRGRVVITCGETSNDLLGDTWEWNGTNWSVATASESPALRSDHAMAYDNARGNSVLFGGRDHLGQSLGDTWIWDISRWTQVTPAAAPSSRLDHFMVSDLANSNVVLFGGLASGVAQNDTWLWNGTTWSPTSPASRPTARYGHSMAYDVGRGRVVLFGGSLPTAALLNDTWEWDGSNWQQVSTPSMPLGRTDHAMTYDSARSLVLLYGGRTSPSLYNQEIWSYDGTTWFNLTPTTGVQPGLRGNVGFVFDPRQNKSFVYGGQVSAASFVATVHDWNGSSWTAPFVGIPPAARGGHSMIWDGAARRTLIFGGESSGSLRRADTWTFSLNPQGTVGPPIDARRPDCGGGATPVLTGFGNPTVGNRSFALDFTAANPPTNASPVFYFLSLTRGTSSFGTCQLVVDPATLFFTAYRLQLNTLASLALPLPPSTSLFGASFYAQCMFVDPPSNLNGIGFSAGALVTIGDY